MRMLIKGGIVVNEGQCREASVIIEDDRIKAITNTDTASRDTFDRIVDATGCYVMPGVIDTHVHFREPGLTHKADIASESKAAAYGGVTSYFEMPNTNPQTTSQEALNDKYRRAQMSSSVNYSFFPGATNDNDAFLQQLDVHRVPGIKLFMGSSTGNMLVDKREALERVFSLAAEKRLPVMAHCEDTEIINRNMAALKERMHTDDPDVILHPQIRSAEACYESSKLGVELARKHGARFHIAHITTEDELQFVGDNVTAEVCVAHLLFNDEDYSQLGTRIKCNPAVKSRQHQAALQSFFLKGDADTLVTVSTDHAPHAIEEKQGGAAHAMSGMPMLQFSLPAMLTIAEEQQVPIERIAQLMSHNPATLFSIDQRGYLREGYKADLVIVKREPWTVTAECIQSKCGWSPVEGRQFSWKVQQTICNGHLIYNNGEFDSDYRGEEIRFRGL